MQLNEAAQPSGLVLCDKTIVKEHLQADKIDCRTQFFTQRIDILALFIPKEISFELNQLQ